jgi:tetratricopeptide (TPR) repeat protein
MGHFVILALVLAQAASQAVPPPDRVDRALELIHEQKYEMAYGVLLDLVKDDPTNARAFPFLAAMELQTGRLDDAESHINALVQHDPENADLRELSGQLYMARRDWKKAEEQWRWIIGQRPNSEQAHMQLAAVLLQQDRYNDALAEVSRSLEISPKRSDARSLRGNILAALGQINQAALDWNIALVNDPDDTVALAGLAVFLRQTEPDRALAYAQRAVELTGWKSLGPLRVLAMVHRARGEDDKAKLVLERAMLAFPNNEALAAEMRGAAERPSLARNPASATGSAAKPPAAKPGTPAPSRESAPSIPVARSPLAFGGLTLGAAFGDLLPLEKLPSPPRAAETQPVTPRQAAAPPRPQFPPVDLHWGMLPLSTISPAFVYGEVPPPPAAARQQ